MNSNKLVLVAVAIVAIGIFALPSTVSLFSGQHTWYDLNPAGNQLPCQKCHQDIQDEMISGDNGVHTTLAAPGCDCHRVNTTDTRFGTGVADGDGAGFSTPGTKAHAAATIACMLCHEQGTNFPFAGGFNQTVVYEGSTPVYYYNSTTGTGGEQAAHNAFIREAIKDPLMEDSNEACIACHTRIGVNITWSKKVWLDFDATENATGEWTVGNWTAGGTNVTQVNATNTWTNPP